MVRLLAIGLLAAATWMLPQAQDLKALASADPPPGAVWLDSLDLTRMAQRRGTPRAGRSGAGRGNNPPPLSLAGVTYQHGIGTLSINELIVDLKRQATRFESMIGIDDAANTGQGSVTYEIWLDNRRAFASQVIQRERPPGRPDARCPNRHHQRRDRRRR